MGNDVKWIKIVVDIFDDEKIIQIEQRENAYAIIVAWFKLLCLAGKQNNSGILLFNNRIPYTDEMLAAIFRMPVSLVKESLSVFEEYGMIEIVEGTVTIPNWGKHQNLDDLDKMREANRIRAAKYRERQKAKIEQSKNVTVTSPSRDKSHDITPLDKEEELEEDKDKEEVEKTPSEPPVFQIELNDGTLYDVTKSEIDYYQKLYPAVNVPNEMRAIVGWNHSNPKKRKTRSGVKRHINTWLADKQNSGGSLRRTNNSYVPVPASLPDVDDGRNPFER